MQSRLNQCESDKLQLQTRCVRHNIILIYIYIYTLFLSQSAIYVCITLHDALLEPYLQKIIGNYFPVIIISELKMLAIGSKRIFPLQKGLIYIESVMVSSKGYLLVCLIKAYSYASYKAKP